MKVNVISNSLGRFAIFNNAFVIQLGHEPLPQYSAKELLWRRTRNYYPSVFSYSKNDNNISLDDFITNSVPSFCFYFPTRFA